MFAYASVVAVGAQITKRKKTQSASSMPVGTITILRFKIVFFQIILTIYWSGDSHPVYLCHTNQATKNEICSSVLNSGECYESLFFNIKLEMYTFSLEFANTFIRKAGYFEEVQTGCNASE